MIGGGGGVKSLSGSNYQVVVNYSGPELSGTTPTGRWLLVIFNPTATATNVIVWATCARVD
jgi:hypothetical protein